MLDRDISRHEAVAMPEAGRRPSLHDMAVDPSRRRLMFGAAAFAGLALAGCSTAGASDAGSNRRCVDMGNSGSRGMRMVKVPCDDQAPQTTATVDQAA